jgi:hypothetical protein
MRKRSNHKTTFRLLLGGLAALMGGPAIAQSCMQPAEQNAFYVRALQSQLMVAALTCGRDADYNAFVRKFQRDLQASYNGIQSHYRRTTGGAAQRELDQYITTLANAQSQDGIRAGSHFCPLVTPLFQMALAKNDVASLAEFAMERNLINPISTTTCAAGAPARGATPARAPARTTQRTASR